MSILVESIAAQEAALVFDRFDEETAWKLGSLLRGWAAEKAWPIIIDIGFFHRRLFFAALPGSAADNEDWARRKRNVVERYQRSTYRIGREMAAKSDTLANRYGLPLTDFAEHGGGFPITVSGIGVVGAIVISGLAQREDHMTIVRALCEMLGHDPESLSLQGE